MEDWGRVILCCCWDGLVSSDHWFWVRLGLVPGADENAVSKYSRFYQAKGFDTLTFVSEMKAYSSKGLGVRFTHSCSKSGERRDACRACETSLPCPLYWTLFWTVD